MSNLTNASINELVTAAKDVVWKKQGIDSYGILAFLMDNGWKYDKDIFHNVMSAVRYNPETAFSTQPDMHLQFRQLTVTAKLMSHSTRCNCYNCPFLQECDHEYLIQKLYENLPEKGARDKYYCALDPTLDIRLGMDIIPGKCPVNQAIADKNKKEDESK